ncbi:MAG: TIGR03862 family flavoprotein [Alphaproteobacteria bacterium]|nr:TIGR03862 family flavoprotein [Alphaproteobacteria bacterium]
MVTRVADVPVAIVGGGPAGLMAAEALVARGLRPQVFDAMPSLGRKFLMAGKGGLNLTHREPLEVFLARYGAAQSHLEPVVRAFPPHAIRHWAGELGVDTFEGTSGRVFPTESKAGPLLRAWLHRLRAAGVLTHAHHRWLGWNAAGHLRFATPEGEIVVAPQATVLALGGASWPDLGSDAAWVPWLAERGVRVSPFVPANCGFEVAWSEHLKTRAQGLPVKSVVLSFGEQRLKGEFVLTTYGIEGGVVYTLSAALRDAITAHGSARLHVDLLPGLSRDEIARRLAKPRGKQSLANHWRKALHLGGAKALLLRECARPEDLADHRRLATLIKALPIVLLAPRPIAEAISSAGGVAWDALDERFMLKAIPGIFCTGEMLDWEAPTGGYLLTACLALGRACGHGVADWLATREPMGA